MLAPTNTAKKKYLAMSHVPAESRNALCWTPIERYRTGIQNPNLHPFLHLVLRKGAAARWQDLHVPLLAPPRKFASVLLPRYHILLLASMEGPFLVMQSTHIEPRCYGARLYVGEEYDDDDFGSMEFIEHDLEAWEQACYLVKAAFGDKAVQRLVPDKTTDKIRVPNRQCIYVLEGNDKWSERHPNFGPELSVQYRIPGSHPDEDVWESADAERFVKVADEEGSLWFVADLADAFGEMPAYLMLHMDIAKRSLRKAAVSPNVELM